MSELSRRGFLRGISAAAVVVALPWPATTPAPQPSLSLAAANEYLVKYYQPSIIKLLNERVLLLEMLDG